MITDGPKTEHDPADIDELVRQNLERRSRLIATPPDLRERVERRHRHHRRRRTAGRAAMATATLAVVVGAGFVGFANRAGDEATVSPAAGPASVLAAGRTLDTGDGCLDVIIWLTPEVEARSVLEVENALRAQPGVTAIMYTTRTETWAEFSRYYADEPEILALVEPEDLPTSFVVTIADQSLFDDMRTSIGPLPGVNIVETCREADRP